MNKRHAFPVSVKGVCLHGGRVLLLYNERDEWELPGGKLELGEDPLECLRREINEETNWTITVGSILDCWQYHIIDGVDVLIVTYGCHVNGDAELRVSHEHKQAGLFTLDEVGNLRMPEGYRRSIRNWFTSQELT